MIPERQKKAVAVLVMIQKDIEADVERFEGEPFNGANVAEMFGNLSAAVAAVAKILSEVIGDGA